MGRLGTEDCANHHGLFVAVFFSERADAASHRARSGFGHAAPFGTNLLDIVARLCNEGEA